MGYIDWNDRQCSKRINDAFIRKNILDTIKYKRNANILSLPGDKCIFEADLAVLSKYKCSFTYHPVESNIDNIRPINMRMSALCYYTGHNYIPLREPLHFHKSVDYYKDTKFRIVYGDFYGLSYDTMDGITNLFKNNMLEDNSLLILTFSLSRHTPKQLKAYEGKEPEYLFYDKDSLKDKSRFLKSEGLYNYISSHARKHNRKIIPKHFTEYPGLQKPTVMLNMIYEVV